VVSALIEHTSLTGKFSQTMGLFEVDEAAMPAVCALVQPRAILVLNIFRDQLDRYGELDTIAKLIGKGISAATGAKLFLNADDPLVAGLSGFADPEATAYFGVESAAADKLSHDVTADSHTCPKCGRALMYTQNFFGHIGHYSCTEGHFNRPKPGYRADVVKLGSQTAEAIITTPKTRLEANLQLPGLYNIYNALAAAAVASGVVGLPPADISRSLHSVQAAFGRVEKITLGSKTIYLLLVKNPTGFNQIIQTFLLQKQQQNILVCINDNFADGRDISWLWDVAFEELEPQHHTIAVAGTRAEDMALRLKYAGMQASRSEDDLTAALNQFIAQLPNGGIGYLVPTYTAMLALRKSLGKRTPLQEVWR
ncbi:MAG TPA: MurT ligase domain-containing protein, partial [Candidatus Polarisedimenticolaceae bacterium]|nr:MurT ligase domain-containing protein [Candidatus Polarisedimenticolaceae bacterium]